MGFNYTTLDYSTPTEMFDDMSNSLRAQLDGMFTFISKRNECISGLRESDYVRFARCYNGSGQEQQYGSAIRDAASTYSSVTADREHQ